MPDEQYAFISIMVRRNSAILKMKYLQDKAFSDFEPGFP
jgi:hypothetical protein